MSIPVSEVLMMLAIDKCDTEQESKKIAKAIFVLVKDGLSVQAEFNLKHDIVLWSVMDQADNRLSLEDNLKDSLLAYWDKYEKLNP